MLHNEEIHKLCSSPNIIRQIKAWMMWWAGHVARVGEERKMYRVLLRRPEGKRPRGIPRLRWECEIRMAFGESEWGAWSRFSWLKVGAGGGLL
jgi:hypothetical protein